MSTYNEFMALSPDRQDRVLREVNEITDMESRFQDMMDEIHGPVKIAGYEYSTSQALAAVDPTAYRCALADFFGSDEYTEINGAIYLTDDLQDAIDYLDDSEED